MIARLRQAQAEASTRQEQRLIQETTERMERQIEALESGSEEEVRRKKEFQRCSTFTGSTLLNWYGSEANLVVPDGLLTIIGVGAFKWRANLVSVQLPPSVRRVGDGAFSFCKKLKCVHLAETTTSFGREAFKGCASLDEIELPQGVTYISEEMFAKCEALEEIHLPEGVETIASGAFAGCRALKRVTLPASLKKIGKSAFSGCFSLQEIEIPEGVRVIEERAFGNCRALARVRLPRTLQTLGREAFIGCTSLRAADMGLLACVPERCFFGDAELEEVALCAQTERIQEQAFARCTALRRLTRAEEPSADFRGEMLQYIDKFAFADCRSLRGVSLREGLREIGEGAFLRCNALKSVSLPSSLQALGKGAFASCAALKDVEGLQPGRFSEECFRNTPYLVGFGPFVIREGKLVAYNGQEARVFIPKTVRVIGEKAFAGNRGLNVVNMGLSVEEIEEKAFADCPNLQKIYIPESVQRIADDAFRNDRSFTIQCARGSEAASFCNRHKTSVEWVAPTRQIPQNGSAKDEVLPWTKAPEERRTPPISSLWEQLRGRGETAAPTPGTQALRPPHSALMQNAAARTQQGRLPAAGPRQAPPQSAPPPRARIEYEVVAPDEGKTSLQLLEDRRVITNNLFSLRLAQPEDSDGRAIGEYEVFLADAFGKPVSETRAVRADKSGEERTHKVTLSLLPGIQTDKSAEYFVIVREKGQSTRVLSRTKYQVNITFAMKF